MRRVYRLLFTLGLAFMASTGLAFAKDSVTIGMVLEPPGLDPTSAPAAAIGEVTHYNIFEGLTKINEDFSVTPLLAEKWKFSPDLKTLTFTLKPNVKFQDDEPFSSKDVKYSFERFAGAESTNKDKPFFASIEVDRDARSDDGRAQVQAAELRGALSLGPGHRGHPRREERDERSHQPCRHRTLQALLLGEGLVDHPRQMGRLSRRGAYPDRPRDLPFHLRSLGGGRGDARRRRRRVPALRQSAGARPVQERSALPGAGWRHRGQDHPRYQQQEEAARRCARAPGDRLCAGPQGDHRRRDERPRNANRQSYDAQRSRLHRSYGHVSA